ncbi:MAG: hypothetical protein NTW05_02965, partial [Pseudonocardiales bacterium]|nr:hypothetical protein [Pseudonocardiales bacterium]
MTQPFPAPQQPHHGPTGWPQQPWPAEDLTARIPVQYAPVGAPPAVPAGPPLPAPAARRRRRWPWVVGGLLALAVVGSSIGGG